MKLKTLKLFIIGAFAAFAAGAFLFSSGGSLAQTGKSGERRDAVLERVANYKNWKQVQKPEKKPDDAAEKKPIEVLASTVGG